MVSPEFIKVVCYSGYCADHRYFKVRGDDKALYIIRHETATDTWELTMFDRTGI
jgi:hypothetical protein